MATKQIMIRTVCLLFLPALLMTAFGHDGTLQEIPDDKVFSDIQKTFITGTWGILTCRFTGPPYAVYWKKGHDPWTAPTLMTWTSDGKTGPRYEDGTCDMDENYSLVIKTVNYTDAGRYICLVSNQHGVLIDNYTDVTVTDIALETKPTVSTQMGQTGVLTCHVNIHPKKVSWIRSPDITLINIDLVRNVIERSGPGYEEGLFNMTKEYSLVINDVTIQHEGRYLCEVIDFDTDNVYRDVTILTVFAKPSDPFPVIQECPTADQSNCIITTDSLVMLTCNVNQYYPDINLVFMHGSERVESLTTLTWNNTDGTKNKSITISADISLDVYKCIASGIPGLDLSDERLISVLVIQLREQNSSPIFAILIVLITICLTVVLLAWMRLRKRGKRLSNMSKIERYIQDHISYAELWEFVKYMKDENLHEETPKVLDLITLLNGDEESDMDVEQDNFYYELCRWKETCDQTINQRTIFYDGCEKCSLHEAAQNIKEFLHNISTEIPPSDFEHIVWHINELCEIKKFLVSLGLDIEREDELAPKKKIVEEALDKFSTWKPSKLAFFNPFIIICSTLEMLGYCTADNNFFQIPSAEKDKLNDDELQRFARDVTSNHWKKLEGIIKSNKGSIQPIDPNENNKVLFETEKMLRDWLDDTECSNYEKRRKLIGLSDELSNDNNSPEKDHYLSDEELRLIARSLDSASMAHTCDKIHITCGSAHADEEERFEVLCQWRTSMMKTEWTSAYEQLRSSLEEVGVSGLLQPLRNDSIHHAEYVDIALDLLMTDILPVAEALRVNVNKLPKYRRVFEPTQPKKGTIGLVADLVESTTDGHSRQVLCSRLRMAGFPLVIARKILVNHIGYGELYTNANAMKDDDCRLEAGGASDDEEKAPGEKETLLNNKMKDFTKEVKEEDIGLSNEMLSQV